MRVLVGGAALGTCLIAIPLIVVPPATGPDIEPPVVALAAAEVLLDDLGGGSLLDQLPDPVSVLNTIVGAADADPLTDFWQQISNYFQGAALLGVLIFGGIWANVAQFVMDAYNWVAGMVGFEPYGVMNALGDGAPAVETSLDEPAVAAELNTVLGDITALFSGQTSVSDSIGIADVSPMFDDDGMADLGALVSSLIS